MTSCGQGDVIGICRIIVSPETSFEERDLAWDQLRPWLAMKGYDLYHYQPLSARWYPQHSVETESDIFFAEMGDDPNIESIHERRLQTRFFNRVGFAQDASFRHFSLKVIEAGSEEDRILSFLHKNKDEAISNCVMPVLEFLDIGNYRFAIMPRWGNQPEFPWFSTVREAGKFLHDILKAYSYLHKNYIVYQDIKLENILLSHFANDENDLAYNEMRILLKNTHQIRYALCDFDCSFLLSPSPSGKPIRLPGEVSFDIYQSKPHDTSQGEPDYDPFVFDIGCLGIFFWDVFFNNFQNFPLIVPLVDKMITINLEDRFTALEALEFVEDHILGGSAELLDQPLQPWDRTWTIFWDPNRQDKWAGLPAEFAAKWGKYKAPKSTYRDLILRWICTRVRGAYEVVKFFRSLFRFFWRF